MTLREYGDKFENKVVKDERQQKWNANTGLRPKVRTILFRYQ